MNISGPLPLGLVPKADDTIATLRLNQRFSAEVLQVAGDRVLLAVDGVRIVARMTSSEQAANLIERRMAQFLVRELAGQTVGLQLLKPGGEAARPPPAASDLVANLLRNSGLPSDSTNLTLAKALMSQGLPVTPDLLAELKAALIKGGALQPDGAEKTAQPAALSQADAQAAAALKAAGLPLSPGAIALAQTNLSPMVDSISRLRARLQELAHSQLSPRLSAMLQNALSWIDSLVIDWSAPPQELAENLRQVIANLGRSLEKELAELVRQDAHTVGEGESGGKNLALALLRRELGLSDPDHPLLDEIDRFLDSLRLRQFENSQPVSKPVKDSWLSLDLPLTISSPPKPDHQELNHGHLRVAYRAERGERQVDAHNTRLVIQVDLETGEALEVDLSVFEQAVGAQVTVSNHELGQLFEARLPELQANLEKLGYNLQAVHCEVGLPNHNLGLGNQVQWNDFQEVNIGI